MAERELIDVSDNAEELSEERAEVALLRALRAVGVEFEINPDGTIAVDDDVDLYSEEIHEAFAYELKMMIAADTFASLQNKGLIVADGIGDDGEIEWRLNA